jgi:sortase (surface protein transpeptidase)
MNFNSLLTYLKKHTKRQHCRVLAFVLLVLSMGVLFSWYKNFMSETIPTEIPLPEITKEVEESYTPPLSASSSLPTHLRIPSISLTAPFEEPLGLDSDGATEVPKEYETVGWYQYGPTPGEIGPAVILGHVDTYQGPAVFYSLGQVQTGDEIQVERQDGSIAIFEVQGFERVKQSEFPIEKVYGNIPYAGIRLITCTGVFNKNKQEYSHNLIVFGSLTSIEHPVSSTTEEEKE